MPIVILKGVRLSYPDLAQPGNPPPDAKPGTLGKHGGQFIFDISSENEKVARAAFTDAAKEMFGENWQAIVSTMEKSKKCIRKGDENLTTDGAIRDGYAGKLYIVARNKVQPLLIGPVRIMPKGTNDSEHSDGFGIVKGQSGSLVYQGATVDGKMLYGGCIVNVKVDIRAMKANPAKRIPNQVYATLLTVQHAADGPSFGSARGTADGFEDEEATEAPAGTTAGEDLF